MELDDKIKIMGRFKYEDKIFSGYIKDNHAIVERELYIDSYPLDCVSLLVPVVPSKIICVGLNYVDHARELGMPIPDEPILFLKPPSSVIGSGDSIRIPHQSTRVDYEAELAVVISKRCKDVAASDADDVIMGYTCFNDITARDLQEKDGQWTRAKSFDTFSAVGPWIRSGIDPSDLGIVCRVNGEVRQDSSTKNLIFDIPYLIEFISSVMTLEEGDIISTGTPPGVGQLHCGDVVEVDIEKIGVLKNPVV